MLQAIRDRASGWIASVVLGLVILALGFFGLSSYFKGGSDTAVARVNDTKITPVDLGKAVRQQEDRMRQILGDQYDPSMFNEKQVKQRALEQLINRALLTQFVQEHDLRLSDAALGQFVRAQQMFQENGKFSKERYKQVLAANQLSPTGYEARVRQYQMISQLENAVQGSALVTGSQVDRLLALEHEKRDFDYLEIATKGFTDQVSVSDDEVQKYYKDHQDQFMTPEKVKLAYVELDRAAIEKQLRPSDEALRQRYNEVKEQRFMTKPEREVRHILVSVPKDADKVAVDKAKEKIENIRKEIVDGKLSFSEAAKKYSDDPGSAKKGGSLGLIQKGTMVKPFEDKAFSLAQGKISEPVRTQFGFHLIEVTAIKPGQVEPFDQVKDQLAKEMVSDKVNNKFYEQGTRLQNLAYETPDNLKSAASALGLQVQHTDWITRSGGQKGIASNPKVVKAAFSPDVLAGKNSDLLELGDDRQVVIRADEHQAARARPLDEVKSQIHQQLVEKKASDKAKALGDELAKQLKAGKPAEELAKAHPEASLKQPGWVERGGDVTPAVLHEAFQLAKPAKGKTVVGQTQLGSGDYAVIELKAIKPGDPSEAKPEQRKQLGQQLAKIQGNEEMEAFLKQLRKEADVEIHQDRM